MRFIYLISSFYAGFSLMAFELVASRILAPMVGSSIFSWTSIIGVIIMGLAIGSLLGGFIADKYKSKSVLGIIMSSSSILILITIILSKYTDFLFNLNLGILELSLLISLYLLFIPSITLGMILPLILKLYSKDFTHLGREYGLLSAMWSFGSILGVFISGFYLISNFGSLETLYSISIGLFLLSLIFLLSNINNIFNILFIILNISLLLFSPFYILKNHLPEDIIMVKETKYYHAKIAKTPIFEGSKILFLDFDSHSLISENSKGRIYTDIYPIFEYLNEDINEALIMGAGAYNLPISMKKHYPETKVSVVEIDKELENIAIDYFDLNKDDIKTYAEDARVYIKKTEKKYDLIFGDTYNSFISVPWHLTTLEFNENVKEKLSENGIYTINFIGSLSGENDVFFKSVLKTFRKTFPDYYVFTFGDSKINLQNITLIGLVNNEMFINEKDFKEKIRTGKYGQVLSSKLINKEDLNIEEIESGVLLTDNFAPIEKMMIKPMKNYFQTYLENYGYLLKI